MLNALRLFENVGQFDSANGSRFPLAKLSLLYAENGRGKTTLAAILRSLVSGLALPIVERRRLTATQPPRVIVECTGGTSPAIFDNGVWSRTFPNLAIFDDQFVYENVCSGLAVGPDQRQNLHELILGVQGVSLNAELQRWIAQIEIHNRELRDKGNAIPITIRGNFSVDDFCALPSRPDIDVAIQDAERTLAAAREQTQIAAGTEFEPIAMPALDVISIRNLLERNLPDLEAAATQRVQAHLSLLGEGAEAWVAYGMQKAGIQDGLSQAPICPFCIQNLVTSPILAHYQTYFSAEYKTLKEEISNFALHFRRAYSSAQATAFERSVAKTIESTRFWSQFAEMPNIGLISSDIADLWMAMYGAIESAISQKEHAPLEQVNLSIIAQQTAERYEQTRASVLLVNDELSRANMAIRLVKERAAAGDIRTLEADVTRLKAMKARHSVETALLCQDYLAEKAAKGNAEQQRDAARAALDQYRTSIFPTHQDSINEYLRRFNAGFRIDSVESQNTRAGSSCNYSVVINNQPVPVTASTIQVGQPSFRTTLSAGDRNTLALAFFFASLERDPLLADKVVVIDDPVSSLDEHRSLVTVQEIRLLLDRVAQVFVLSHSKPFLCTVWEGATQTPKAAIQFTRQAASSAIQEWDVTADMVTEHDRRHELLRTYLHTSTTNNRPTAQALRPVLEAFLRVAYPENFPAGTLLGPFLNVCNQRVGTAQEILNQADITELLALKEYGNQFHHDTNPAWQSQHINDAELLDFVQRTLNFAKR